MSFKAFDYSIAMICYEKNNVKYGMSCAWAMQVDYDKLVCLLGEQSDTGNNLVKGDIVGISTASRNQKKEVLQLGDKHSTKSSKFAGLKLEKKGSAILISDAAREMVCEVLDVLHLPGIEVDNLLYVKVLESKENNDDFLHYSEL